MSQCVCRFAEKKKQTEENKDESLRFGDLERVKPRSIQRLCLVVTVSGAGKGLLYQKGARLTLCKDILMSCPCLLYQFTLIPELESDSGSELLGYKGSWNGWRRVRYSQWVCMRVIDSRAIRHHNESRGQNIQCNSKVLPMFGGLQGP